MRDAGFTLVEMMMVVLLIGVLAVVGIDVVGDSLQESRFEESLARIKQIEIAISGDPQLKESGSRSSFGFLGDIGALPSVAQGISALVSQPTPVLPIYTVNATARIGLGWNGPYLTGGTTVLDYTRDAWGNVFVYLPTASPPSLTSLGSDGAVGGTGFARDIVVTFPAASTSATVNGFICERGGPFVSNAEVELNFPNGAGVLQQTLVPVAPADSGRFSFSSVPFGVRSLSVYRPTKAAATAATTLGPIILSIDKPNYLVPCAQVDISP